MVDLNSLLTVKHRMEVAQGYVNNNDHIMAEAIFYSVLDVDPRNADAMTSIASLSVAARKYSLANEEIEKALSWNPKHAIALAVKAQIEQEFGNYERALELFNQSIAISSSNATVFLNMANLQRLVGDHDGALKSNQRAADMNPMDMSSRFSLALTQMTVGGDQAVWDKALAEYELRQMIYENYVPKNGRRQYNGDAEMNDHAGKYVGPQKSIMVVAEQGIGDVVMMGRYGAHLKKSFKNVYLRVRPEWKKFAERIIGFDAVFGLDEPMPDYDMHVPMMSLMRTEGYPAKKPDLKDFYLSYRPNVKVPSKTLRCFRIGLCWKGNSDHSNDRYRSIPVRLMADVMGTLPLEAETAVEFYSLQQADQTKKAPEWIQDCGIDSLDRLADVIGAMDLVITVDTSIAHITGAMGVPGIVLLPPNVDWRWGTEGVKCHWYKSLDIVRSSRPLEWAAALCEAKNMAYSKAMGSVKS